MSAKCGAPHPQDNARRCIASPGTHGDHFDRLPDTWPNIEANLAVKIKRENPQAKPRKKGQGSAPALMALAGVASESIGQFKNGVAMPSEPTATQEQAAARVLPHTGTQRRRVYDILLEVGSDGLTDDEISFVLDLSLNSVRPRRGELESDGLVAASGRTRANRTGGEMIVWVALPLETPQTP